MRISDWSSDVCSSDLVVTRKFFSFSLGGSDELSGYAFAISISWALSFATLERANIRIDALYQKLPTRLCALLDWVSMVCLAVFIVLLTRYAVNVAAPSGVRDSPANSVLDTPFWENGRACVWEKGGP